MGHYTPTYEGGTDHNADEFVYALVDTRAVDNCIDIDLAENIGLPTVD